MTRFVPASLLATGLLLSASSLAHAAEPEKPQEVKPLGAFQGHTKGVFQAVYSPNGAHVATSGKDQVVRLWDASTRRCLLTLKGATNTVYGVAFSPDGKRLAAVGADQHLRVWSVPDGQELFKVRNNEELFAVVYSPDGSKMAITASSAVILVDAEKGKILAKLAGHSDRVLGAVFTPDGKRLVTSCGIDAGQVKVWNVDKGTEVMTLPGATRVLTLALSADGRRLAGACGDGLVRIWEMATGREALALKGHTLEVYTVAFSPDGRRLASSSGYWQEEKPGEVKVWDLAEGKEVLGFGGHNRPIWTVAFRPDGKRLLTATGCFRTDEAGSAGVGRGEAAPGPAEARPRADRRRVKRVVGRPGRLRPRRRAYRAVWALSLAPKEATPFLKDQARPPDKIDDAEKRIARLITELDDRQFKVRQNAQAELERLGRAAHPALKKALDSPSAEVRKRAQQVLDTTAGNPGEAPVIAPEELRLIRAVEALQKIGGADVKPTLEKLAEGKGVPLAAAEAAAALAALGKEPKR